MNDELPTSGLNRIASETFVLTGETHRLITFLNQSLKGKGFIFGMTKAANGALNISIYNTDSVETKGSKVESN
jgi:hypothetical protein